MADLSNKLSSKIDPTSARFEKNMRAMADPLAVPRRKNRFVRVAARKQSSRSTQEAADGSRADRACLSIRNTDFVSLGLYAAFDMYEEWGGAAVGRRCNRPWDDEWPACSCSL